MEQKSRLFLCIFSRARKERKALRERKMSADESAAHIFGKNFKIVSALMLC